jgi:hypothetical protein
MIATGENDRSAGDERSAQLKRRLQNDAPSVQRMFAAFRAGDLYRILNFAYWR